MAKFAIADDVTWEERPRRFFRKKRSIVRISGALAVLALAGLGLFFFKPSAASRAPLVVEAATVAPAPRPHIPSWCAQLNRLAGDTDLLLGSATLRYCKRN